MDNLNNVEILEFDEKPRKNKLFFLTICIFILIILFGIGFFFFLRYAKNQKDIELKNDTVELGKKLNTDIIHYIGKKRKNCTINLDKININKVGKYKYTVKCGKVTKSAIIEVKDTTAPTITLKALNVKPLQKYEPTDFIISSNDLSEYSIVFKDDNNIKTQNGLYLISIIAKDIYDNKKEQQAVLIVSETISEKYLVASKETETNLNASLKIIDKIGFNFANFYNNSIRIYEYKFNNKESFDKTFENYVKTNTIENRDGQVIINDSENSIELIKIVGRDELNDLNGSFPYTFNDISSLYNKLGYTTRVEK